MGKVYKIARTGSADFLQSEYRPTLALLAWVSLTIVLALTLSGFSKTGEVALVLLLTPMLMVLLVSSFQTRFPRSVAFIISTTAFVGALVSMGTMIYFIVWAHFLAEPPQCAPDRWSCDTRLWDHALLLRESISNNVIEFLPLMLTSAVYAFALYAQFRVWSVDGTRSVTGEAFDTK